MNWKDFFKMKVFKHTAQGAQLYFQSELIVPDRFPVPELFMQKFDHWNISEADKKQLSLNSRKILLCHEFFHSPEFHKMGRMLVEKMNREKSGTLEFSTDGGGMYLFLEAAQKIDSKKHIICHTSELPLPIFAMPNHPHLQFIYRPENHSFLTNFPSLWEKSDLLNLFEIKEHKSKVA